LPVHWREIEEGVTVDLRISKFITGLMFFGAGFLLSVGIRDFVQGDYLGAVYPAIGATLFLSAGYYRLTELLNYGIKLGKSGQNPGVKNDAP